MTLATDVYYNGLSIFLTLLNGFNEEKFFEFFSLKLT
jgi:hypothetical protein